MHPNYWTQVLATLYLFAIVPPSPNKYAFTTFSLNSFEYLDIKKCNSKIELYLSNFRGGDFKQGELTELTPNFRTV